MKTQAKFAIGGGIIVICLIWLGWLGARESKTYYHTIAELPALKGSVARQRMRVAGNVEPGSIQHLTGRTDFVLVEQGKTLRVSYVGSDPLPDTFKDNAQALVEGKWMPDGRFVAEKVQAKCASKYQTAPGEGNPGESGSGSSLDKKS